jgi:hypothetical protein
MIILRFDCLILPNKITMEDNLLDTEFGFKDNRSSVSNFSDTDRYNLGLVAYWARFLGIIGYVFLGLFLIIIIALVINVSAFRGMSAGPFPAMGGGIFLVIIYIPFLYIFYYLSRAAHKLGYHLKTGLANNDDGNLSSAFDNLTAIFRTQGIMTAVVVVFYAIFLVIALLGGGLALLAALS